MEEFDELPPPTEVTPKLFGKWRSPRLGTSNPERMDNPVWAWLIRSKVNAFRANELLAGPSPFEAGPGWCFDRLGQSSTKLPDGREVLIAGEHEDSYDPDFFIYNDVVIKHSDGRIEIHGYPEDEFPPTDFHSATLVGEEIIIIGNLGNPEQRRPGFTPVFILELDSLSMRSAETTGTPPGWIHSHEAVLSGDAQSIFIRNGKLQRGEEDSLVENIDDWRLHLGDWRWEKVTSRNWKRWELGREDEDINSLWEYEQAAWSKMYPEMDEPDGNLAQIMEEMEMPTLEEKLGGPPDLDLFARLFQPPIEFEALPDLEGEYGVKRIRIDGVIVRYVQDSFSIQMTVEGELRQTTLDLLIGDLLEKFSQLEKAKCVRRQL